LLILLLAFGIKQLPHVDRGNDKWIIEIQIGSPNSKAPVLVIVPHKVKINKPLKERDMLSTRPDSVVYTIGLFLKKSSIRNQTWSHLQDDTNDTRKAKTFLEASPCTLWEDEERSPSCRPVRDHMINGIFFLTFIVVRILL
jgi:hypothetical protein